MNDSLRVDGLRGSDAVQLTWSEIHFDRREIERITQKRRKLVVLRIHTELMFAFEGEYQRRKPQPHDRVLLNPSTGKASRRPRLYARIQLWALAWRGTRTSTPIPRYLRRRFAFRWRWSLRRGSDAGRYRGNGGEDYAPFVPALRERVRRIMESGTGLEASMLPSSNGQERVQ